MRKLLLFLAVSCGFCSSAIADTAQIVEAYGKIPLAFTLNKGQTDSRVKFTTAGNGCSMFFTPTGTTFLLNRETAQSAARHAAKKTAGTPEGMMPTQDTGREYESFVVKTVFVGANQNPEMEGEGKLSWNNNYFVGSDPAKWRTDVPNYANIRLKEVYPGIDLVYYGNKSRIKYDFVVKTGEDPSNVVVRYDLGAHGGDALSINGEGELVVRTPLGDIIERKPRCYQNIDGKEVEVPVSYRIMDASLNSFGFDIGAYTTGSELYIDPELYYSTFLGGSQAEHVCGITVDSIGHVYVTGWLESTDYPVTTGAYDTSLNGGYDAFITKLNSDGTALLYSTFLGGSGNDFGQGITVDADEHPYVAGGTFSYDYPVTSGAYSTDKTFSGDVFVAILSVEGNSLQYSTHFGGNSSDQGMGIALDGSRNVYITGNTYSSDYPVTAGAFDTSQNGNSDAFISILSAAGKALLYSTYLGGGDDDNGKKIALDGNSIVYIMGNTYSSGYPVTAGAYDTSYNGSTDMFVTILDAGKNMLLGSTFLGSSQVDDGYGLAVDGFSNAYVTGYTTSHDYPVTTGAYDTSWNSISANDSDAFVTKLNADVTKLRYSTFLGGKNSEFGRGIAVDGYGNAYVTGETSSPNYPVTTGAHDTSLDSTWDAFVTKVNAEGTALQYSTFLGGSANDYGYGIAVDGYGSAYVTGETSSSDYPVTSRAYDTSMSGSYDLFVTKLSMGGTPPPTLAPPSKLTVSDVSNDQGHRLKLSWTASPSETNGSVGGYRIFRSRLKTLTTPILLSRFALLDSLLFYEERATILIDSVTAGVTTYTDSSVPLNGMSYYYWLQAFGVSGASKLVGLSTATAVSGTELLPIGFHLNDARPNPFNPTTTIEYTAPRNARILLRVYNVSGQKVATLAEGMVSAGQHRVVWDAGGMPSGVYFYTFKADRGFSETKKVLLLK